MRNIKLILAYDGTDFHGWQCQPGLRTVQQVLEEAILELTQHAPATTASGRTDAGVLKKAMSMPANASGRISSTG